MALDLEKYFLEEHGVASANDVYTLTLSIPSTGVPELTFTLIETGHSRETTTWKVRGHRVFQVQNASTVGG